MLRLICSRKGFINVFVAVLIVVLLGCAALAIDIGMIGFEKARLQNACDAAALAGALELPGDEEAAKSKAYEYAAMNGISIGEPDTSTENRIVVTGSKLVSYSFAKVLGISSGNVTARAIAVVAPIETVGMGVRPFGVTRETWNLDDVVSFTFGAGGLISGNGGFVNVLEGGTSSTTDLGTAIESGGDLELSVGDPIETVTGVRAQPVYQSVQDLVDQCTHGCTPESYVADCPRVITVPLVEGYIDVTGGSTLTIIGFARFFLLEPTFSGGQTIISGRFVEEIIDGDTGTPELEDFGSFGVRLWEDE